MKDFKMAVPECMREGIQQRLSDVGVSGEDMNKKGCNFIYVENNEITSGLFFSIFLDNIFTEITLTEFYALTEKSESKTKIEKIRDLAKQLLELTDG